MVCALDYEAGDPGSTNYSVLGGNLTGYCYSVLGGNLMGYCWEQ